jgi:predicted transcriptional regulator
MEREEKRLYRSCAMSTLSLRLPDSLHKKVRELAAKDSISINQCIATAVAEKMAALLTSAYLIERGRRGSREKFEQVLAKVRNISAVPGDELDKAPAGRKGGRTLRRWKSRGLAIGKGAPRSRSCA